MSLDSLKLFNAVPRRKGYSGEFVLLRDYGVLVTNEASYDMLNIMRFMGEVGVGNKETNSSFYSDWKTVRNLSDFEMLCDQLTHYFSTYGLEYFGVDSVREGLVYLPERVFHTNNPTVLRVISAEDPAVLLERCFRLLNSGMALSQETIKSIIRVLGECGYEITGEEKIANREAEVYFYEISGKLPTDSSKLFRYLLYYASGSTLVINDKATRSLIETRRQKLPYLDEKRSASLAQTFNRYKDLWMCIKTANPANRTAVNHISKLSKIHHKPMPENVMNLLTSRILKEKDVELAAKNSTVFQIIRVINALRLRSANPDGSVYRIRNGKQWTTDEKPLQNREMFHKYYDILLGELRERFSDVRVYCQNFVDYSFPVSEKSFVGNIPEGTVIRIPQDEETFLVGVHWDDLHTDLDLRADSIGFSLGWNTGLRSSGKGLMHSGDMTRGILGLGASEWIYASKFSGTYNLKINVFSGSDFSRKFKFIIGKSKKSSIQKGYSIAPEEILCSYTVTMGEDRQMNLGMVYPEGNSNCFFIGTATTGNGRVGGFSGLDKVQQDVSLKRIRTSLRLSDVVTFVDSPEKATVDLSLDKLTKDSFLDLLK